MEGTMIRKKRPKDELLDQAEKVGRESGLDEKLARYRERREAYEGTVRGGEKSAPSLPAPRQREAAGGPGRPRTVRGFVGDGLYS